jgi:hypothetical protein
MRDRCRSDGEIAVIEDRVQGSLVGVRRTVLTSKVAPLQLGHLAEVLARIILARGDDIGGSQRKRMASGRRETAADVLLDHERRGRGAGKDGCGWQIRSLRDHLRVWFGTSEARAYQAQPEQHRQDANHEEPITSVGTGGQSSRHGVLRITTSRRSPAA